MQPLEKTLWIALVALLLLRYGGGVVAPVVPDGPLHAVVVYETLDTSPELARMLTALRTPPESDKIKAAGHRLDALDDEHPTVKSEWLLGVTPPALVILNSAGGLVKASPLPTTVDGVLEAMGVK